MPKLTTQEKLRRINADPALWLKNFVKIDCNGELVPFVVNPEQKDFLDNMDRYCCILKSRQIGFSTLSLGLMLYYAFQIPNSNYLMLAQSEDATQNLFTRLKLMYESIHDKYRIGFRKNNEMELLLENNSRIAVKTASKMKAESAGRSYSLTMIHLSEFAFYDEKFQEKGLLALENALIKNENARIIIESTANGLNYFYYLFKDAIAGNSKYKAFFYNWLGEGAKKQFKYEYELAKNWYKKGSLIKHLYDDEMNDTEKKLYALGATKVQLMWRRWKLQDITEEQFRQEYPATWQEAFVSTQESVFNQKQISDRLLYIPEALKANEIKDLPDILYPYLNKSLFIYKLPKPKEMYFGGVDSASGLSKDGDLSTMSILDSSGEQVAVFYQSGIPVYKFAHIVNELGNYYNYACLMIERNSYGLDLINRLKREIGYLNLNKTKKWDRTTGRKTLEIGWNTDNVSKSKLIQDFKEAFEEGVILLNDRETLQQMQIYMEKDGKLGNVRGKNNFDDLVIATALAVQSLKLGRYYV